MTTGHVFIATSLDGYIARKDHTIDWLENQGTTTEEHGYTQFIDSVDGIIFGRKTYEVVLNLISGGLALHKTRNCPISHPCQLRCPSPPD